MILAYSGNLLASLTLPARSKALNTFEDLLQPLFDNGQLLQLLLNEGYPLSSSIGLVAELMYKGTVYT